MACNGVLFNNIYAQQHIQCTDALYQEVQAILEKMRPYAGDSSPSSVSVLRSYLQLILALCSREKLGQMQEQNSASPALENIVHFQDLLEQHFAEQRNVSFYASHYNLSVSAFSKKIKSHFGKTPSKLIQERLVLEAKKLLHLTYKPVKEIAATLLFEDEFYFSRYFKKEAGVSPSQFRDEVGISIAAK